MTDRERMQISTRHPVMFVSIMDGIKCWGIMKDIAIPINFLFMVQYMLKT
jgi:hypothetical protein